MKNKKRMTELDIRMVIEEIEAWGDGHRGNKLTWITLERIFSFTRQTLYSKERIRIAFEKSKLQLNNERPLQKRHSFPKPNELEIRRLKNRICELEQQLDYFQKLWIEKKI